MRGRKQALPKGANSTNRRLRTANWSYKDPAGPGRKGAAITSSRSRVASNIRFCPPGTAALNTAQSASQGSYGRPQRRQQPPASVVDSLDDNHTWPTGHGDDNEHVGWSGRSCHDDPRAELDYCNAPHSHHHHHDGTRPAESTVLRRHPHPPSALAAGCAACAVFDCTTCPAGPAAAPVRRRPAVAGKPQAEQLRTAAPVAGSARR